jgi:eukaryotic-like serine/threonine-protein kinase
MTERFQLLEPAGRGAMGVVWRARDSVSGEVVAVKLLRGLHATDAEYIERFAREVELARRVQSEHVVRVLGYGARDGVPYVVMEYVPGRSLRAELTANGPFDPGKARAVLAQVAEGLAAIHAAGVIHRDVKASNILVTPSGVAKLTDFGIARSTTFSGNTQTGTMLGTPAYLAPEGPRDARSDLYSLGVVYYELLAGVVPFAGTSHQEVILAHIRRPPDLLRLPVHERKLAAWLLSKDPAQRPQRAGELLAELKRAPAPSQRGRSRGPGATRVSVGHTAGVDAPTPGHPVRATSRSSTRGIAALLVVIAASLAAAAWLALAGPGASESPSTGPSATANVGGVPVGPTVDLVLLVVGVAAVAIAMTVARARARARRTAAAISNQPHHVAH